MKPPSKPRGAQSTSSSFSSSLSNAFWLVLQRTLWYHVQDVYCFKFKNCFLPFSCAICHMLLGDPVEIGAPGLYWSCASKILNDSLNWITELLCTSPTKLKIIFWQTLDSHCSWSSFECNLCCIVHMHLVCIDTLNVSTETASSNFEFLSNLMNKHWSSLFP